MPELRRDPVLGRWVIIATERAQRPNDFARRPEPQAAAFCPFCPGHEESTPPEILAYRGEGARANQPGWSLRVVPNRFPALMIEGGLDREGHGMYDKMNGVGAHEVIIETPEHSRTLADLDATSVEALLWAYKDRIVDLRRDTRFRSILIFKNQGEAAGASLEHSHSQLIALPVVPRVVSDEMEGAKRFFNDKERCVFCDIINQDKRDDERVVYENDQVIALCPWAPRSPFETWLLPKQHGSHFEELSKAQARATAEGLRQVLRRLDVALEKPPYNFILHTAPLNERGLPHYHWHFEIVPTLTKVAGFEWGSGFYINPTPPEEAAAFLRKLEV
jgi:UDPglucose--hexose-1-phosphate uridylyltransferase